MRVFKPKAGFRVKVHKGDKAVDFHMVREVGSDKWIKKPGRLFVMLGYNEKSYDDIDNLIKDFNEYIPEKRHVLKERTTRLKHKLYGIRYHMENFIEEENKSIKQYEIEYKAPGTTSTKHNPKLIYEVEAFLFQIKSALDILAQIISMIFNLNNMTTYSISENGNNKVIKKLKELSRKSPIVNELVYTLTENDGKWIIDTIDMRNEVTHTSDLKGFMCFIQHAWEGGELADISYPSMPDGQRASSYMLSTYMMLYQFFYAIFPILMAKLKSNS
jgi:hypothetical protein